MGLGLLRTLFEIEISRELMTTEVSARTRDELEDLEYGNVRCGSLIA